MGEMTRGGGYDAAVPVRANLRIGLDAHVVGHRKTGNETFVCGLASALAGRPDVELLAYLDPDSAWPSEFAGGPVQLERLRFRRPEPRIMVELPVRARRDRLDVLHVQYAGPLIAGVAVATAVHDLSFLDLPETLSAPRRLRLRASVGLAARRSQVLTTLSTFSRDRLLHHFNVDPRRVVIAPPIVLPPASPANGRAILDALGVPRAFVLAFGDVNPRKNLPRLVAAMAEVRRQGLDVELVTVGPRAGGRDLVGDAVGRHDANSWTHRLGYVDRSTLGALYREASAVAYVSLYEGFGLPVAEAMAAGTPVVASSTTSIPEVAGGAALLVDPTDPAAIAQALVTGITDVDRRAAMIEAGRRRAAAFLPEAGVEKYLDAYRVALGR
jgi:glycosyltransferase involved in cell wall biosynthesis